MTQCLLGRVEVFWKVQTFDQLLGSQVSVVDLWGWPQVIELALDRSFELTLLMVLLKQQLHFGFDLGLI